MAGWMQSERMRGAWLAMLLVVVVSAAPGCSARKDATGDGTDGRGLGRDGYSEGNLDGYDRQAGGSSLTGFESTGVVAAGGGTFEDIHFGYDSVQLDSDGREVVRRNAAWMKDNPDSRVEIEGHCDEQGTSEYNLALGARRAKAVRDAMVSMGVPASRLSTVSYGEELPICREASEICYAKNRRAHLVDLTPKY